MQISAEKSFCPVDSQRGMYADGTIPSKDDTGRLPWNITLNP